MILTLLLILLLTLSGAVLTYFYSDDDSLLVRLCAGNIIGSVIFGLIAFLLACLLGLTPTIILLSFAVALFPLALLTKKDLRERFLSNVKTPEINAQTILSIVYYFGFFVLFYFFFKRAMIDTTQGIFTGGSHNLGDLPFHLGAIFSFTEGGNLPPENPSFAFAKFTYPFMADFITSCFVKLGVIVRDAMLWQNLTLAFSLLVLFENFVWRLTKNRLAGKLAPVIFLFCGGLGFVIFFRDYWRDGRGLLEFLWNLSSDYTIREKGLRWGNSLTTLFLTQRSLLLGMPITLITLTKLWEIFTSGKKEIVSEVEQQEKTENSSDRASIIAITIVGLIAGTLPLIHVHSLIVLFVVSAFLFFLRLEKWRLWVAFGMSVAIIALPELIWVMTGSATRPKEFFDWHFGWDARGENIFIFWLKNLGLFIPLLFLGFWWLFFVWGNREADNEEDKSEINDSGASAFSINKFHIYFYLPFLLIFIIANLFKLAPWEWDNIKVLIYWYLASVPVVAWFLAKIWEENWAYKFIVAGCLIVLVMSGMLDVWRVMSRQVNYLVFSRDSVKIAEQIKQKTDPKALFLNAPTYNSAVVLSGRRSLMRYSGHLSSYGIDYGSREDEVKRIYEGTALAESFLKKNGIEYVLISPEEESNLTVNEDFFSKYPVIAESGEYRVYQIKK